MRKPRRIAVIEKTTSQLNLQVGNIFAGASIMDEHRFYQVISLNEKSVKVCEIKAEIVDSARCRPFKDNFKNNKSLTMKAHYRHDNRGVFLKSDICNCRLWDETRTFRIPVNFC